MNKATDRRALPAPLWGWFGALSVTALAALLRFWELGRIKTLIFDETYYVKGGWSLWREGVEMAWPEGANQAFEAGNVNSYLPTGDYVVHPEVGKWLIGLGEALFGASDPASWRIASAFVGTLSVLVLALTARRLFRSNLLGFLAGLLLAIDGSAIVHSRTGMLDNFLAFFVLAAFAALLRDRDLFRARLYRTSSRLTGPPPRLGVHCGIRWWRLVAGVLLGLACATKWSGLYFLAVFGIMTVLWDFAARRRSGDARWPYTTLLRDAPTAFLSLVGTSALVYLGSWAGWFSSGKGWGRYAVTGGNPVSDALASLWKYHREMFNFHVSLGTEHPYAAPAWSWPLQLRPTLFYFRSYDSGEAGCELERCFSAISSVGNPLLWWLSCLAVLFCVYALLVWRDGRAAACLSGIAAGWVPWLFFPERTVFTFYGVVFLPWLVLCLVYAAGIMLGDEGAERGRRFYTALFVGSIATLLVLVSAFFYPVWTGQLISPSQWQWHLWLPTWA
ncbi:dolichyl-phosphate-mannose--protein mannosyltransferase [Dermabacteraceae bacterium P13103]